MLSHLAPEIYFGTRYTAKSDVFVCVFRSGYTYFILEHWYSTLGVRVSLYLPEIPETLCCKHYFVLTLKKIGIP